MKKRDILTSIGLLAALLFTAGAVTLTNDNVAGAGFVVNGESADFTAGEILKDGVSGKSIYLERLYLTTPSGATFYAVEGDLGASGATTTLIGPVHVAANSTTALVFTRPIKLTGASPFAIETVSAVGAWRCGPSRRHIPPTIIRGGWR